MYVLTLKKIVSLIEQFISRSQFITHRIMKSTTLFCKYSLCLIKDLACYLIAKGSTVFPVLMKTMSV